MFQFNVGHAFAIAESQRLQLAFTQNALEHGFRGFLQIFPQLRLVSLRPAGILGSLNQGTSMSRGQRQEAVKELARIRTAFHAQEIYDLNKNAGSSFARSPN
jgi:hypothetical protein